MIKAKDVVSNLTVIAPLTAFLFMRFIDFNNEDVCEHVKHAFIVVMTLCALIIFSVKLIIDKTPFDKDHIISIKMIDMPDMKLNPKGM